MLYNIFFWIISFILCIVFILFHKRQRNQARADGINFQLVELRRNVIEWEIVDPIEGETCCICLDSLLDIESQENVIKTKCDHYYHRSCIKGWLQSDNELNINCPLCLQRL